MRLHAREAQGRQLAHKDEVEGAVVDDRRLRQDRGAVGRLDVQQGGVDGADGSQQAAGGRVEKPQQGSRRGLAVAPRAGGLGEPAGAVEAEDLAEERREAGLEEAAEVVAVFFLFFLFWFLSLRLRKANGSNRARSKPFDDFRLLIFFSLFSPVHFEASLHCQDDLVYGPPG